MAPPIIFNLQLVLGYVACLLAFRTYFLPWLKSQDPVDAHRAIATLHSFRFFGLVFILPGVIGSGLPGSFGSFAAYGDLATGVLALLALLAYRMRTVYWLLIVTFNVVGTIDLVGDYYHAVKAGVPEIAGQLGATYAIPVLYVPLLMITHITAFYWLLRPQTRAAQILVGNAVASD